MRNEQALGPELENVLTELTSYHRARLFEHQDARAQREAADNKHKPISLARALTAMTQPSGLQGTPEGEFFERIAKLNGHSFDAARIEIPFSLLHRDLTVASAASAGYLVGTETQDTIDILRPWSVTTKSGLLVETGLVGDQVIPKVSETLIPYWLSNEASAPTGSTPTLSQIPCTPKQVSVFCTFSRQLAIQANADAFVRRQLLRAVGTAVDQAVISGSGSSGQPTGLLNVSGLQTQSGGTLNAGVFMMKQKCATKNVNDANISFLSTPAIRELLETREVAAGGGRFVWQGDRVADRMANVSTDVPAAIMICGDWANVYFGVWGQGFTVEINPYDTAGFKAGLIQARIIVSCDVAVLYPSAFVVASSIT